MVHQEVPGILHFCLVCYVSVYLFPFCCWFGTYAVVASSHIDSIAIVLAITIPRVPGMSFYSPSPLVAATGDFNSSIPTEFSRSPANFSFPAFADIQVDTTSNIIPLTFNHIDAQVWYPTSNFQIGTGYFGKVTLPAHSFPIIQIPLNFSYIAPNDTDPTWVAWYNACKNSGTYTNGVRPGAFYPSFLACGFQSILTSDRVQV